MSDNFGTPLDLLLQEIREEVRGTEHYTGRQALAPRVLEAMALVPRHVFIPEYPRDIAYVNRPLPIGHGQTISQPYIVALMTDLLGPRQGDVILEVGTGSGYQAAILAKLVKQVYSLEIVDALAQQAAERLQLLGCTNVAVRAGNGHLGWPEHAPFDGIMVTAAATAIPPALVDQLKPGGTLVIPVGGHYTGQDLVVVRKDAQGRTTERGILPVIFVPMTGSAEHGQADVD